MAQPTNGSDDALTPEELANEDATGARPTTMTEGR